MRALSSALVAGVAASAVLAMQPAALAATDGGQTYRVSLSTGHSDPDRMSTRERISRDGRFVVFESGATNLVSPKDTNGVNDVYYSDLSVPGSPRVKLVSRAYSGGLANGPSFISDVSGDGRWVVFQSNATNLVSGWTHAGDVYIRDMQNSNPATANRVVSVTSSGARPDGVSERPTISEDGRWVAFNSTASNITPGSSHSSEIYVRDLSTGKTTLVVDQSGSADDSFRAEISGSGHRIAFASDRRLLSTDQNTSRDVYWADLTAFQSSGDRSKIVIKLVSVASNGKAAGGSSTRPAINYDGSIVTYQSFAGNILAGDSNGRYDCFERNMSTGQTKLVSAGVTGGFVGSESTRPAPSDDGRYVVFASPAPNLVTDDKNGRPDVFLRDMVAGKTRLVSKDPAGNAGTCSGRSSAGISPSVADPAFNIATRPYVSGDGRAVAFTASMCNLVTNASHGGPDKNRVSDIFVRKYASL